MKKTTITYPQYAFWIKIQRKIKKITTRLASVSTSKTRNNLLLKLQQKTKQLFSINKKWQLGLSSTALMLCLSNLGNAQNIDLKNIGEQGITISGMAQNDRIGLVLNGAGDFDGDGIEDVIFRATSDTSVYLIYGSNTPSDIDLKTLTPSQGLKIKHGLYSSSNFGFSLNGIGDFNKDGFDDIIISDPSQTQKGEIYVVFGNNAYNNNLNIDSLNGQNGFEFHELGTIGFGYAVSSAGDFNADGYDDLIIGDPTSSSTNESTYILFGTDTISQPSFRLYDNKGKLNLDGQYGFEIKSVGLGEFGNSVTSIGDYNGDGFDDVAVGGYWGDRYSSYYGGEAYVVLGTDEPMPSVLKMEDVLSSGDGFDVITSEEYSYLGSTVSSAGDFNGDGYDDVLIGIPEATVDGKLQTGASVIVWGKETIPGKLLNIDSLPTYGTRFNGNDGQSFIGKSLSSIGDFNQDRVDDIAIGHPKGAANAGITYVVFGKKQYSDTLTNIENINCYQHNGLLITGANEDDKSSHTLSSTDFNGDGIPDLIIGAPYADASGQVDAGKIYIIWGGDKPECALISASPQKTYTKATKVYPIPTSGLLQLSNFSKAKQIHLVNPQGELIQTFPYNSTLDVSTIQPGVYFLLQGDQKHKIIKN